MASLPLDAPLQAIEEEILVQEAMMASLSEDDVAGQQEIQAIIDELEELLDRRQRNPPPQGAAGEAAEEEMVGQDGPSNPTRMHSSHGLPGAFPSFLGSSYSSSQDSDVSSAHASGLKRSFAQSSLAPGFDGGRARPMPPYMGNRASFRAEALERQRREEQMMKMRHEAAMADAALAARLSQHPDSPPIAGPSHSTPMAANHARPSNDVDVARQWGHVFGTSQRARPELPPMTPQPHSIFTPPSHASRSQHLPHQYASPSSSHLPRPIKPEFPQRPSNSPRPTGLSPVIDLTGDSHRETIVPPRPAYPMPYPNQSSRFYNPHISPTQNAAIQAYQGLKLTSVDEQIRQERMVQNDRILHHQRNALYIPGGYQPVYRGLPGSSAASSLNYGHQQMSGFMDDLSDLNNLINGPKLVDDDVTFLSSRYLGASQILDDESSIDPEQTREELRKLMENIQPEDDTRVAEEDVAVDGLTVKLKGYQFTGVEWEKKMEEGTNRGGILADDMGLGKTVQAIALMVTNKSEDPLNKTTLIVAPVALLRQWQEEIAQKITPRHRLRTYIHHGSAKKKTHRELRDFDVVLTTYGTLAAEQRKMDGFLLRKKNDPLAQPREHEKCLFIGSECRWYRVILDEAQSIKNRTTRTAKGAFQLNARSRFCLTGTPMMNGVEELFSLVHFLRIRPYSDWTKFNLDFVRPLKASNEKFRHIAMKKLQALLKAVLLRRNKQTKINGKPILILPERTVEQTHAVFSDDEQAFYTALQDKQQVQFNRYLKAGTVGRSYAQVLLLLLRLRQACCHPHLIKDFSVAAAADISPEQMDDLCKSLDKAAIARIKETEGKFECPICLESVDNPAIFIPCGHDACPGCLNQLADPGQGITDGDENGGRSAKCPECRGEINTKRVTDWQTFQRIHMSLEEQRPKVYDSVDSQADTSDNDSDDSDDSDDDDDDDDGTLNGFILRDDVNSETSTESDGEGNGIGDAIDQKKKLKEKAKSTKQKKKKKKMTTKKSEKAKGKEKTKMGGKTLAELKKMSKKSKKHKMQYMKQVKKDYIPSAKIEKTVALIKEIMEYPEKEKIIIFSQWTSLLDLLEIEIDDHDWGYRRYDGSMNAKERGDAVDDFKHKASVQMMLVSLKAGNAGLNLNIASQVIILDPFWNPYIEEQAIDRAHRLGQTRAVMVHRILVPDTVEDRILQLQDKKRTIISEALDEKASKGLSRLSVRELGYLFGITRSPDEELSVPHRRHH